MQCICLCWRQTYHILLLFKSKLLSLLSNGNPSSLRISFSDISIVSNWSWKQRKLMALLLYSAYKLRLMGLYMYESCSIQLKPNIRCAYTRVEVTGLRKQELILVSEAWCNQHLLHCTLCPPLPLGWDASPSQLSSPSIFISFGCPESSILPIYTTGQREVLWELSVL